MRRGTMEDMKAVSLDQLPVDANDRRILARTAGIHGALHVDGKAIVFGPACGLKTEAQAVKAHPAAQLVWRRLPPANRAALAIALVAAEGITAHAAALRVGVHVSAVYRAQTLREKHGVCECCGQPLKSAV